jgi:hypothetical protein
VLPPPPKKTKGRSTRKRKREQTREQAGGRQKTLVEMGVETVGRELRGQVDSSPGSLGDKKGVG